MGGSSKSGVPKQKNYFGTLAGAVNIGPNEDLVAIILNGQEVWPKGTPWSVGLAITSGTLYVFDAQTWICTTNHTATTANAPGSGLEGWTEYVFTRGSETYDDFSLTASGGTHYGVMRFYWGSNTQTVDPLLMSTGNDGGVKGNLGFGDQHPDYQGVAYVLIMDFLLGQDIQSGPNIEIVTRRKPKQTIISGAAAGITDGQANLAAVAAELLTDPNCLGLPATMLDATSFQAAADWLQTYQDKYGASVLIDSSESVPSLFDKLVQMVDGYIRFNPTSQKIELGVYQHGVIPTGYTTLTADSFTKFPKFSAKSWQETISRATVRYMDCQVNYQQTSAQVDDPRAFFILGTVREQSLDRNWIARASQARIHGQETLRVIGHAQLTGDLEVRREIGRGIRAGDYVLVDVDLEPNVNSILQFFRVTKRKIPPTGPITLTVLADNTLALVPWTNQGAPVLVSAPVVPPVTSFRFVEVPTVLSGARGEVICLAQRPNNLIVGATIYFDTNSVGTFTSLGIMESFAALATLYSNVAAGDTTLHLTVDTTQVDADFFTDQFSALDQANDTLLAIMVQTSADQIAESGGFQVMEICSVSVQTLISAGRYDLTVLRGRQNTSPAAFATATTEVWLIQKSLLSFFNHANFDQLRANRLAGLTPYLAQFRICPYTFVNALALSDATSEPFQFPLNSASAPSLVLTAPGSFAVTYGSVSSYPLSINVNGTWNDPDGNLVQIKTLLRLSTDADDRIVLDQRFSQTTSKDFNTNCQIDKAGTWTIKLIARDSTNLITERDITAIVAGAGARCARVDAFDVNDDQITKPGGGTLPAGNGLVAVTPGRFIPFGPIKLKCSTPGATIKFSTDGVLINSGVLKTQPGGTQTYDPDNIFPFNGLVSGGSSSGGSLPPPASFTLQAWATAPGYSDSGKTNYVITLFY